MKINNRIQVFLTCVTFVFACVTTGQASQKGKPPVNALGIPVRDSQGQKISYPKEKLGSTSVRGVAADKSKSAKKASSSAGLTPTGGANTPPFWQYSIFGSGIGGSNIIIAPAPITGPREIIIGGNSSNNFGGDDFWMVLRYNSITSNYDQVFVSPIYAARVARIALGNVIGDSQEEIIVLLDDGHVYFYDLATKASLGQITTGTSGLEGLSAVDLDGDGYGELIVTSTNNLYVFSHTGSLLWQVPGAGGYDVVAGQMDDDPAIEIAATGGKVVDAATHAVQWTNANGFGSYLRLAPLAGHSYKQLIAAKDWDFVYAYDVATQLPLWSLPVFDIDAIDIADVDNDGTPELIVGDGQWGTVHVHDLATRALKWETENPDHGVTNVAVGDVDDDGAVDLLWGAGWSDTGSDHLYVASTTGNHAVKWQSIDLQGPFLGPLIGELDGSWPPELVICSLYSESTYDSGRILVFDLGTMRLRGISAPVINNLAWEGVRDLKLRDVDGDGRMEIVVAGDYLYDGAIEIYGFNPSNTFTLKWSNTTRPEGNPYNFVDVVDLDGNGTPEIIAGNTVAHTGSDGVYVYIYDYPSGANPWRSVALGTGFSGVIGLVVDELAGDGVKKIAALVENGDLYTFDGPTRGLEGLVQQTNGTIITSRVNPSGLIRGDSNGVGHFLSYSNHNYTESFTRQLGSTALDGINVLFNEALWTGTNDTVNIRVPPLYDNVEWQGPQFGPNCGRFISTFYRDGHAEVFISAQHAAAGFVYESSQATPAPSPTPTPVTSPTPTPSPTPTATVPHSPTPTATATATHTPTATATPTATGTATATPLPTTKLLNISTRLRVLTEDNAMIGGFIVSGNTPKQVIVRAIGPSLANFGVPGVLVDPILELHGPAGFNTLTNDNWRDDQELEIQNTGLAPSDNLESAIMAMLPPGAYTAVARGNNNGIGVGLVEAYDLVSGTDAKLANISTRGFVDSGDNAMIGGFILGSATANSSILIRAIGPSLATFGVPDTLSDPILELRDSQGNLIDANDNWRDTQQAQIEATGIAPTDNNESAILQTLVPGAYTAIVRGKNQTTGVGLVEAYQMATPAPTPTATATATSTATPISTPTPSPSPMTFLNLSTRVFVGTGEAYAMNAFIVSGLQPKQILVRGLGPSLGQFGIPNPLVDPIMELHGPVGFPTINNDNWRDTQEAEIQATGLAPTNDLESAILVTLDPGSYTVIVRGKNNGVGVCINEVYDLGQASTRRVTAVGTRGQVMTGNDILIGGVIINRNGEVVLRGLGGSLSQFGIPNVLQDPRLELRDNNGALLIGNDDWQDDPVQAAIVQASGLAPSDALESALYSNLAPGTYTGLVFGVNNGTGIGYVQFYALPYTDSLLPLTP